MFGDGFLHVLKIDAEALAFDDEFLELLFEEIGWKSDLNTAIHPGL